MYVLFIGSGGKEDATAGGHSCHVRMYTLNNMINNMYYFPTYIYS